MNLRFSIVIRDGVPDDKLPGELAASFREILAHIAGEIAERRPLTYIDEHGDRVASAALQAAIGLMYEEAMKTGDERDAVLREIQDHCAAIVAEVRERGDYTAPAVVVAP